MEDFQNLLGSLFNVQTPSYMGSLLGESEMDKLKSQAGTTGLINMVAGYLAQPKTQGYGSALPYLAKSYAAGQQGAQGVYSNALQDWETQQKVAEMKRKVDLQNKVQSMISGLSPEEQVYAQLAPEQWVANQTKAKTKAAQILNADQAKAYGLPEAPAGQAWQVSEKGFDLIGSSQKEGLDIQRAQAYKDSLVKANPNDPRIKEVDAYINKLTNFAPQQVTNIQNFLPAAQELQKTAAQALTKNYELLQFAPQTIATMEQAKALVPQAVNFTGSLGEQKLQFAKFFNNNFGTNIDPSGIQNAEQLRSALFANVMDNLKKMDASPSQQQQAVMAKAFGTIDTDPKALPKIIDIYENIIKNKVDIHNQRVDQLSKKVELPYDLKVTLPEFKPSGETLQERIDRIKKERQGGKNG